MAERFCDFLHGFQDEHVREEGGVARGMSSQSPEGISQRPGPPVYTQVGTAVSLLKPRVSEWVLL